MGVLVRFRNNSRECWSSIKMENGDPVWISCAQSGVIVKKSKMGIMGKKLYDETNVRKIAETAQNLDRIVSNYNTPPDMTNPVLRVFTQTALDCKSTPELSARLNQAPEKEMANKPRSNENEEKAEQRLDIIGVYGKYIQDNPPVAEFRDISELPYPKEEILDAICLEIVRQNDPKLIDTLKAGAEMLADFQQNVGPKPITMTGLSHSEMDPARISTESDLMELASKLVNGEEMQNKYKSFKKIADEELDEIRSKLLASEVLGKHMPEDKKREILG